MPEIVRQVAESCAAAIELLGLAVIVGFALSAGISVIVRLYRRRKPSSLFREIRQSLAGGILLGLEFLVAADIVHTVAVDFSFHSVGILAAILLIRTFLSFTLELELTGRWPWQRGDTEGKEDKS